MSALRVTISGQRKLFQDQMKPRITLVAIAPLASGNMTFQTMRHSARPSMRAASISDRGTASKLALNTKMQTIVEHCGSASPKYESSRPSRPVIRYAGMMVAWKGTIMQERNSSRTNALAGKSRVSA